LHKFDILDPNLTVMQSRFLEASAGTGKIFAIEHLVARLVKQIPLEQILAVTFTREAALEMKERIRSKLEGCIEEEIGVFTIHGFCHLCLTEFAFEASAPVKLSGPDTPDHLTEMKQVVEDFFRTGPEHLALDVASLLKRNRYDIEKLKMRIVEAMQKAESPTELAFPDLETKDSRELFADLLALTPRHKKYQPQVEKLSHYLAHKDPKILLEEKVWFFEKLKEESGFFHMLQTQLLPPLKIMRDPKEMLKRVAFECRQRWHVKKSRGDHFSFDDLLEKMQQALSIPAFLEKVRAKYKAVIVDEFQDTDPIQWTIFETLFKDTHILYLVGDPKQSIYGFRNADIYTYMRAKESLGEENRAFLDTNFRSSPQLIEVLNTLFTKNPDWIDLPSLPGSLSYYPVHAGRTENDIEEDPITYFGVEAHPGRERSWPTKSLEEEKIFPYIASKILSHKKQFSFSDMVVLIKDRFQAQRLQLFLNRYNIPSSIKRTLHLAESKGYLAMEILLKAIAGPNSDSSVQAALKGPLMQDNENPFSHLKELFEEKGFAPTFAYFVKHHYSGGAPLFLELRQTAELLMQERSLTLDQLLKQMTLWKQMSPEMDERLSLRLGDDESQVAIMTTFASKGLEFEIVFALDMASSSALAETNENQEAEKMRKLYVAFTRAREKLYIPRLIDTSKKLPLSPIEKFFQSIEVPIEWIENIPLTPYTQEQEAPIAKSPQKPQIHYPITTLTSFSTLAKPQAHTFLSEHYKAQDLTVKTLHTLPLGAETGTVVHAIFENYFENRAQSIEQVVCETLMGTHLEGWEEVLSDMVEKILHMPLIEGFSLSKLQDDEYFQEMEFLFPQKNQWIKGFADLVFKREDTFYILDWKINWLGPSDAHYTNERLHQAMSEHDYYLQAKLYTEALTRYVKPLYKDPQFGGAIYVFLRGKKSIKSDIMIAK